MAVTMFVIESSICKPTLAMKHYNFKHIQLLLLLLHLYHMYLYLLPSFSHALIFCIQ